MRGEKCVFSASAPGMHVQLLTLKCAKQQPVKVRSTLQRQLRSTMRVTFITANYTLFVNRLCKRLSLPSFGTELAHKRHSFLTFTPINLLCSFSAWIVLCFRLQTEHSSVFSFRDCSLCVMTVPALTDWFLRVPTPAALGLSSLAGD